ncbi:MAG: 50S ribosomal protein L23 [Candidatus Kerfeldbacteria bacterium]|nr:50S ribosomal protein L23 [Candidatus Kerfeldbacteria bacterium]
MSILDKLRKKDSKTGTDNVVSSDAAAKPAKKSGEKNVVKEKAPKAKVAKSGKQLVARPEQVMLKPLITEKATLHGVYIFQTHINANKQEVKKAIQQIYGVTPVSVRIMNVAGKAVRWNNREGKRKDWKKAVVRLKAGETINVYSGT